MIIPDIVVKQGDLRPAFRMPLHGADGNPVSLTGATVKFFMRPVNSATIKINNGAVTVIDASSSLVEYQWSGSDTADPGLFEAEFQIDSPIPVKPLTVPSYGYLIVEIAPQEPRALNASILKLRRMVGERTPRGKTESDTRWTDSELSSLITDANGNINLAAYWCWSEKEAEYAELTDYDESGSKRPLSQKFKQAQAQAKKYRDLIDVVEGVPGRVVGAVSASILARNQVAGAATPPFIPESFSYDPGEEI